MPSAFSWPIWASLLVNIALFSVKLACFLRAKSLAVAASLLDSTLDLLAQCLLAVAAALTLFAAVRRLRRALSTLGVAAVVLNIALVVVLLLAMPAQLDGQMVSSALEPPALPTIAINLSDTQRALVWVAIACNTALLVKVGTRPR